MKDARFTETRILRVLKEVEGGRHVKGICRENGVSEAGYYCGMQDGFTGSIDC
ncbi:transposase [Lonsdalea populi]|uniref:transposase n=1 Tax=Lonsdalea populi TaxID=1172565 RepID=UPI0035A24C5C